MTFRAVSVVLRIASATTVILGQAPQRSEPTFRVQVDAVEFDAFVTDAQGTPLTDLTVVDTFTGGFPDGPAVTPPPNAAGGGIAPPPSPGPPAPNMEATFALRRSMASFRSIVER